MHKNSESPDGRYGVLVLSNEAAIKEDQTEGNITYLADLQTHQTLGETHGTDYFEGQNHRDLTVAWGAGLEMVRYDRLESVRFSLELDSGTKRFQF